VLFVVTAVFNFTFRPVLNGTPKDLRPVESDKWFLDAVCSIGKVSPLIRDPTHRQSITVSQSVSYNQVCLQFVLTAVLRGRCSSECCVKSRKGESRKTCSCLQNTPVHCSGIDLVALG
jgi:hypothetical protein